MAFRVIRSLAVVSALFAISLGVCAAEPDARVCPAIDAPVPTAPRVRVFTDPATGKRRAPTADELRQIAEERLQTRRARVATLVLETHAGGMKSVDLGDAFLMEVVLEEGADGATRARCLPSAGQPPVPGSAPAGEK